ncbi:hypothetical protein LWC35_13200 [Pseudonocardia kujensis]|uniref:hypothetical protein n=1 Tax=Pseudonocardia kujensis TaxID=1128675 RepID=UPI001E326338|nr:hypothetical protein [Pseudonocardia kujensis]MCE0763859.1 hypothetical protein [Pseudonocardia kujensis]
MQDPGREDREDRDTRTATAEDDDRAREQQVDELAEQLNVANNCSPPRPGDPEY